ncbi:MAG: sigma-70 family RNA polymerase sigma factor [Clostridiaceae bacterium]
MDRIEKVNLAKKGDENAFYELISDKKEMLYKTAYTYVRNKEDALDIVSEAVYKSYISIKKLKDPRFFDTYLIRILINSALDFIKKNKRTIEINEAITKEYKENLELEEKFDLKEALNNLDERYKTVIILKYFNGFTLEEIAKTLEKPLGTVKTNLYRGLKILKLDLKEAEVI